LPYCRRCGTKLEEEAHFCHKCGTPVTTVSTYSPPAPSAPMKPRPLRKDPIIIGAIVLVALLVSGVIIAAILAAPISTITIDQTIQDKTVNVEKLNFNFEAGAAKVNVFTQNIDGNNFLVSIQGSASKGIFGGDTGSPVQVTTTNDTLDGVQTVTVKLEEAAAFLRYNIDCNIYVNPNLIRNLNVTSTAGEVTLVTDKPATFESLNLKSSAGAVGANLQNATIAGNITLGTSAGTVDFRASQINVEGNYTVNLHSSAGSINVEIIQTHNLQGNLQVNAVTQFGSVNNRLTIDGDVGAKITSQTTLGSINLDVQRFSGNKSPIQSDNYPATSNIEINNRTNAGSINIHADYQSSSGPSIKN
jgi:hypothetical protein